MNKTIDDLEKEIEDLKQQLKVKESELYKLKFKNDNCSKYGSLLSTTEICRYSRQMLVPSIGVTGQINLNKSKVLIIGAGGLGCPCALYLAAAGVGEITIIDNDEVDLTNLHRQVLHTQIDLNTPKVISATNKLNSINSNIKVIPLQVHVDNDTILKILKTNSYDVVMDCTDNVATRYLLNDACVLNDIPLVSGSALQLEGQLTVYNYKNGPCYRCIFPIPPPVEAVTSCGDGGVVGVVPGVIGVLQALEAIKIITKMPGVLTQRLLIFDGADTIFRNVKLRPRNVNCVICGNNPNLISLIDYEEFCGSKANDKVENINILQSNEYVHVNDLFPIDCDKLIIDVRPKIEYEMCSVPNTINFPYTDIIKGKCLKQIEDLILNRDAKNVYVICRRGNDSQRTARYLKSTYSNSGLHFINISGGLHSYSKHIDSEFPVY